MAMLRLVGRVLPLLVVLLSVEPAGASRFLPNRTKKSAIVTPPELRVPFKNGISFGAKVDGVTDEAFDLPVPRHIYDCQLTYDNDEGKWTCLEAPEETKCSSSGLQVVAVHGRALYPMVSLLVFRKKSTRRSRMTNEVMSICAAPGIKRSKWFGRSTTFQTRDGKHKLEIRDEALAYPAGWQIAQNLVMATFGKAATFKSEWSERFFLPGDDTWSCYEVHYDSFLGFGFKYDALNPSCADGLQVVSNGNEGGVKIRPGKGVVVHSDSEVDDLVLKSDEIENFGGAPQSETLVVKRVPTPSIDMVEDTSGSSTQSEGGKGKRSVKRRKLGLARRRRGEPQSPHPTLKLSVTHWKARRSMAERYRRSVYAGTSIK